MKSHTILFLNYLDPLMSPASSKRTYTDFEGATECMMGICEMYEEKLRGQQKLESDIESCNKPITYTLNDLFEFIDNFSDICCLVFDNNKNSYAPHGKEWIKRRIYMEISNQQKRSTCTMEVSPPGPKTDITVPVLERKKSTVNVKQEILI